MRMLQYGGLDVGYGPGMNTYEGQWGWRRLPKKSRETLEMVWPCDEGR